MATYNIDLATAAAIAARIEAGTATADDLAILAAGEAAITADEDLASILGAFGAAAAAAMITKRDAQTDLIDAATAVADTVESAIAAQGFDAREVSDLAMPVQGMGMFGNECFPSASGAYIGLGGNGVNNQGALRPNITVDFRDEVEGFIYRTIAWTAEDTNTSPYSGLIWKRRAINANPQDAWTTLRTQSLRSTETDPHYRSRFYVLPLAKQGGGVVPCLIAFQQVDATPMHVYRYDGGSVTLLTTSNLAGQSSYLIYDTVNKVILCQNASNAASIIYADAQVTATDTTVHPAYPSTGANYGTYFGTSGVQLARYMNFNWHSTAVSTASRTYWAQRLETVTGMYNYVQSTRFYQSGASHYSFHYGVPNTLGYNFNRVGDHCDNHLIDTLGNKNLARPQINRNPQIVRTGTDTFEFQRFMYFPRVKIQPYRNLLSGQQPGRWMFHPQDLVVRLENAATQQEIFTKLVPIQLIPNTGSGEGTWGLRSFLPVFYDKDYRTLTVRRVTAFDYRTGATGSSYLNEETFHV